MNENGYVKITFEDVKIAETFFENDKHLDEFLAQVCRYYIGFETTFKYKNVKKYFETYKKVMDRVIKGRSTGSIGGNKRVENQRVASETLEGVVEGGVQGVLEDTLEAKVIKEKKINKRKKDKKIFIPPLLSDVIEYFSENGYSVDVAKTAFNFYNVRDWKDSNDNEVSNWKLKMQSVWFKEENKQKNKVAWVKVKLSDTIFDLIKSNYEEALKNNKLNCDNPIILKEYYK
jgi:hypothetical protein